MVAKEAMAFKFSEENVFLSAMYPACNVSAAKRKCRSSEVKASSYLSA